MFYCTVSKVQSLAVYPYVLRNSVVTVCSLVCVTLRHMSIGSRIAVAVAFKQVDCAPDAKTGTKCDYQSLKNGYCAVEECQTFSSL